jgi:hypothetical protein
MPSLLGKKNIANKKLNICFPYFVATTLKEISDRTTAQP